MLDYTNILGLIAVSDDSDKLRTGIETARKRQQKEIEDAAFRRLIAILPKETPGTVEYDLWQTIYAFEHVLSVERGKTTRLSRTGQKVARLGEVETLKDWAVSTKSTDGFKMSSPLPSMATSNLFLSGF